MRRILVPYDQSEQSDYALEHAMGLDESAEVVLLHVVELRGSDGDPTGDELSSPEGADTAADHLEAVRDRFDDPDRIETAVEYGRPVHAILNAVDDRGIDHVVLGSHGRDGAARLLLGSVAETVARRSPVPVTVVRAPSDARQTETVLVPFDGSTHARNALRHVFEQFPDATVVALFVAHPPTEHVRDAGRFDLSEDWADERQDHTESVLGVASSVAETHDRSIETEDAVGDPSDGIVAYAESEPVDHIVIGSSGRDGIARLLLGSVAETVVRRAPVSVTIVK